MRLAFVTVDVFADRPFGGNPLAVFPDARGLDGDQMQAIAGELNLSETTFVLPPVDPANTARVRIFTPRAEIPFAGHPNVGTAFVLARAGEAFGKPVSGSVRFEEGAGLVPIDLIENGARLAAPQPLAIGAELSPEAVAEACSLDPAQIVTAAHAPCVISTGNPFVTAEVATRAALAAAAPVTEAFARHAPADAAAGIQLYVKGGEDGADVACRVFAPLHGIAEDPATGSAGVNLVALLAHLRPEPDLDFETVISQGHEIGRPSVLRAAAKKVAGVVTAAWIGGTCVPMTEGVFEI